MGKILLILESDTIQKPLTESLSYYEIHVCQANEAPDTLAQLQPDALILDLFLPGTDGFTLMEDCQSLLPPVVLLLSVLDSDFVRKKAAQLGASFIIRKPFTINYVVRHLTDMMLIHQYPELQGNHALIADLLAHFHVCAKKRVIQALGSAVLIAAENPNFMLTKDVYPALCHEYGVTSNAIDQAFRRTIRKAWDNRAKTAAIWEELFPGCTSCPSNSVFISTLAAYLRKKYPSRFREGKRLP